MRELINVKYTREALAVGRVDYLYYIYAGVGVEEVFCHISKITIIIRLDRRIVKN